MFSLTQVALATLVGTVLAYVVVLVYARRTAIRISTVDAF
jgi:hypothetical protein